MSDIDVIVDTAQEALYERARNINKLVGPVQAALDALQARVRELEDDLRDEHWFIGYRAGLEAAAIIFDKRCIVGPPPCGEPSCGDCEDADAIRALAGLPSEQEPKE